MGFGKLNHLISYLVMASAVYFGTISAGPEEKELPIRKIKYVNSLIVNRNKAIRTVALKNEFDGINDIKKLIKSSGYEEAWVYLPDKEEWIETGIDEEVNNGQTMIMSDADYEISLSRSNNRIYVYHFHPTDEAIEKESKQEYTNKKSEGVEQYHSEDENDNLLEDLFNGIEDAAPSTTDLKSMVISSVKNRKINPKVNIVHKICSVHGVTEYSLTKKGFEHYHLSNQDILIKNLWVIHNNGSTNITSDFIDIKFTPYKSLESMVE